MVYECDYLFHNDVLIGDIVLYYHNNRFEASAPKPGVTRACEILDTSDNVCLSGKSLRVRKIRVHDGPGLLAEAGAEIRESLPRLITMSVGL